MRNVLGVEDADHEESSPDAPRLAVTLLSCSLVGQGGTVLIRPGSRAAALYGCEQAVESYWCNYGVGPEYAELLDDGGLSVSGWSKDGEIRIVELRSHPFFVGTLFLPQLRSTPAEPHPLLEGFVAAARAQRPEVSTKPR